MLALTSATGKLGSAVIQAILDNKLIDPSELVVCTSTNPLDAQFAPLHAANIRIRNANFDYPSTLERAFSDCDALFLVSTPRISMDYNDAPPGQGREAHHKVAIDAAIKADVKHIYYTSLGFAFNKNEEGGIGRESKAGVMRAHLRTEAYLRELSEAGKVSWTVIREGLYNESWPLYFGYYHALKEDKRKEIVVAGDGKIAWTAIADMAYGTAKILSEPRERWAGKTMYLSQKEAWSLEDIARMVSRARGEEVRVKVVGRKEYEDYYVKEMGMERASVEWWSSSYVALEEGECEVRDGTLEKMLEEAGRKPKPLEETIEEMLR